MSGDQKEILGIVIAILGFYLFAVALYYMAQGIAG